MAIPVAKLSFREPGPTIGARNAAHVYYIATHGADGGRVGRALFGPDPQRPPDRVEVQRAVRDHTGPVWRLVLSLREDDALRWGYQARADWERLARLAVPQIAARMGLDPGAVRWAAALHRAPGHPHLHVVLWEDPPTRRQGKLRPAELREVRQAWARQVLAPVRAPLAARKTILRDSLRVAANDVLQHSISLALQAGARRRALRARAGQALQAPGRLSGPKPSPLEQELASRLLTLAGRMPGRGRAVLAFMPQDVKDEALRVAERLLQHPSLAAAVNLYRQTVRQMAGLYTSRNRALDVAEQKAMRDLRGRIAQLIVRAAAQLNRDIRGGPIVPSTAPTVPPVALGAVRGLLLAASAALSEAQRRAEERAPTEEERARRRDGRGRD
ncbi:MobP3 family relaxase [Caldinitratiruptor microaerophilus]|uniref:Uncharacterized protein n=1 Tax=Caldinitratiruptor microaerophilus TaxID=671077 RepID=A0AA35CIR9_9FIRM|nr:MobP3 family relaxase [Caldinitratiruptor microaerophilus]BDG59782.1 hypothetical protein caldi_08720 [Caldinitratiruptor microaerophilus]